MSASSRRQIYAHHRAHAGGRNVRPTQSVLVLQDDCTVDAADGSTDRSLTRASEERLARQWRNRRELLAVPVQHLAAGPDQPDVARTPATYFEERFRVLTLLDGDPLVSSKPPDKSSVRAVLTTDRPE